MEKTKAAAGAGSEEEEICNKTINQWRCKNASADNELRYCEKHYKDLESERKKLPLDEERCCQTGGNAINRYRCKNFKMSHGGGGAAASVPKTKLCEKHYNYSVKYSQMLKNKRGGNGEGAGFGQEIRGSKRRRKKKLTEEEEVNTCGGSAKIGAKRKRIETTSGELKSSTGISESVVESENLDQTKCFELSVELELEKTKVELEKIKVETGKRELELEKMKVEVETRRTATRDDDVTEYWRNKCDDLEILVLTMEIENLAMRYEDRSLLSCEELRNSDKIKGLQNEITLENNLNAYEVGFNKHHESESEFPNYFVGGNPSGSLHLLNGSDNIKEREDLGCWEERPSQHGSSSQAHDLEMSKKTFVNLVSESDDAGNEQVICTRKISRGRCKNASPGNELNYCDKHYKNLVHLEMERKKQLPPDEQRCCMTNGGGWRCKNFRMGHGAADNDDHSVPKTKFCEKHRNSYAEAYKKKMKKNLLKKKTSADGNQGAGPVDTILERSSAHIGAKRDTAKRTRFSNRKSFFDHFK